LFILILSVYNFEKISKIINIFVIARLLKPSNYKKYFKVCKTFLVLTCVISCRMTRHVNKNVNEIGSAFEDIGFVALKDFLNDQLVELYGEIRNFSLYL
jgi:hypothetical protein